jgi:gamma-glutamyltranspeptidase/glutathione hydrolase
MALKMRLLKSNFTMHPEPKKHGRFRQSALIGAVALIAGSCVTPEPEITLAPTGFVPGYVGGAASDEPRASAVAFEILNSGGTAADAAVALTFTLTATHPVAAGLGGGGACLVYNGPHHTIESLDFLPRIAAAGGTVAVPGLALGLDQLHRRYGVLDWGELILEAEALARRGAPVSQAMAVATKTAELSLQSEPIMAQRFLTDNGQAIAEDGVFTQVELATVLAQIRIRGAGDFYFGQSAATFLDGAAEAGASLTQADLRAYAAVWSDTLFLDRAGSRVYVAPGAPGGGVVAGQLWAMLADDLRYVGGGEAERAHLFAEASARAYGDRGNAAANPFSVFRAQTLMSDVTLSAHTQFVGGAGAPKVAAADAGATGFVVMDGEGSVVACTLTMGRAFGIGRTARPTGVILSPNPDDVGTNAFVAPVMVIASGDTAVSMAAAAGGPAGPAAIAKVLLAASTVGLASPRLVHPGLPDQVLVETAITSGQRQGLVDRGHSVRAFPILGSVNSLGCVPQGGNRPRQCKFFSDPRTGGLAVGGRQ